MAASSRPPTAASTASGSPLATAAAFAARAAATTSRLRCSPASSTPACAGAGVGAGARARVVRCVCSAAWQEHAAHSSPAAQLCAASLLHTKRTPRTRAAPRDLLRRQPRQCRHHRRRRRGVADAQLPHRQHAGGGGLRGHGCSGARHRRRPRRECRLQLGRGERGAGQEGGGAAGHGGVHHGDARCALHPRQVGIHPNVHHLERHAVGGAQRGAGGAAARQGAEDRGGEGAGEGGHLGRLRRDAMVGGKDDAARRGQARPQAALQRAQPRGPVLQQAQRACVDRAGGRAAAATPGRRRLGGGRREPLHTGCHPDRDRFSSRAPWGLALPSRHSLALRRAAAYSSSSCSWGTLGGSMMVPLADRWKGRAIARRAIWDKTCMQGAGSHRGKGREANCGALCPSRALDRSWTNTKHTDMAPNKRGVAPEKLVTEPSERAGVPRPGRLACLDWSNPGRR